MNKKIEITKEYQDALDLIKKDKNVFINGSGGVGKSEFLKYFVNTTKKEYAVVAPTGVAAINLGENVAAETIHRFFGFGIDVTYENAKPHGLKLSTLRALQVLIIDEISMVKADMMDCIDKVLKKAKESPEPFGGVQLVVFGDLLQLSPIVRKDEKKFYEEKYDSEYFYDSKICKKLPFETIEFTKIFRQSNEDFKNILNRIRFGEHTQNDIDILNTRVTWSNNNEKAIVICMINRDVDKINDTQLSKIDLTSKTYTADYSYGFNPRNAPCDEIIELKVGARVMCVANDTENNEFYNGLLGNVVELKKESVVVTYDNGNTVEMGQHEWNAFKASYDSETKTLKHNADGSFKQIPLKLAWAISVHKSQSKTFDNIFIKLMGGIGSFATGQMYVALSRATNIEGIALSAKLKMDSIKTDKRVVKYLRKSTQETLMDLDELSN